MIDMRHAIVDRIAGHRRESMGQSGTIAECDRLDDLGIDSMAMIALLIGLEQDFGLDFARVADAAPPKTVGELIDIAADALPARQSAEVALDG
jgi:acyl carrier protein